MSQFVEDVAKIWSHSSGLARGTQVPPTPEITPVAEAIMNTQTQLPVESTIPASYSYAMGASGAGGTVGNNVLSVGTTAEVQQADQQPPNPWGLQSQQNTQQVVRYNEGKPQYSLITLSYFQPLVAALEYGAQKYPRFNYRAGYPQSQIADSLMRHISDFLDGKILDQESGVAIIGLIQANAMFLGNPNNINDITGDK